MVRNFQLFPHTLLKTNSPVFDHKLIQLFKGLYFRISLQGKCEGDIGRIGGRQEEYVEYYIISHFHINPLLYCTQITLLSQALGNTLANPVTSPSVQG